jgi:diacylglycerol O-acyltransferase / wax synthase
MIPTESVASVDSAWLRMDEPGNLMIINGVMMLDRPLSFERFREVIASRLVAAIPRTRQRIAPASMPLGTPRWEEDPHFDLAYHVRLAPLERADQASLQNLVGRLMSERFDPARPLWTYYFVPQYEGGCAMVARVHHCIGDGLALLYALLKMDDNAPEEPPVERRDQGMVPSVWDAIARPLSAGLSMTRAVEESVVQEVKRLLANPSSAIEATRDLTAGAETAGKLLLMSSDPQTAFKGPLTSDKRAVWSRPVPLASLKELARVTGSTINDVVLASVAGALRTYLLSRDQPIEGLSLRAVVPVNLRAIEEAAGLGNGFGLVFVPLPIGIEEPLDRVFEVRKRMQEIKKSPEALLTFQVLRMLGHTPSPLFETVVKLFGMRATAVMTNVIGPREPLQIAGATLKQAMFWVPCSGRLGMGVSIFSYCANLWVGIATDASLVRDPERIVDFFEQEMHALEDLAAQVRPQETAPATEAAGV